MSAAEVLRAYADLLARRRRERCGGDGTAASLARSRAALDHARAAALVPVALHPAVEVLPRDAGPFHKATLVLTALRGVGQHRPEALSVLLRRLERLEAWRRDLDLREDSAPRDRRPARR